MAVYVDYDHTGVTNQQGNIPVLKDQQALSNAVKLWLCSFRGERLYRPTKGGFVVGALMKPMSEDRAQDIQKAIKTGLRTDFQPSVQVTRCEVTPDYDNNCYYIHVEGNCPAFRSSVYTDVTLNNLYK